MKKLMMGLVIVTLLTVNGFLGYFLYEKVSNRATSYEQASPLKSSAVSPPVPEQTSTKAAGTEKASMQPTPQPVQTQKPPVTGAASSAVSTKDVKKSSYLYYIDDAKIKDTIGRGKQCVLKCDDEFMLPLTSSPPKNNLTVFYPTEAVLSTPYEEVLSLSGYEFYKNDKAITFDEAKEVVDFDNLKLTVQFKGSTAANLFTVYLEQDKKLEPASSKNEKINHEYSLKTVRFNVNSIDFNKKAVLVVQHKEDHSTYQYDIDFKTYVR